MGAPKGNTNALKHGLYAKHFSPEEREQLRRMPPSDYRHEIYMMRLASDYVFDVQKRIYQMTIGIENSDKPMDVEALAKITNSLSLAVTALNTTERTYALFNGMDTGTNNAFDEALNSMTIFLDDKYLTETNEEAEQQGEIFVEENEPPAERPVRNSKNKHE
jgi:hypothetical protein